MNFNGIKSFYRSNYVNPTREGLEKFINKTVDKNECDKVEDLKMDTPKIFRSIKVSVEDVIYPSSQLSKIVLKKNKLTFSQINQLIFNAKTSKFLEEINKVKTLKKLETKMPKVKVTPLAGPFQKIHHFFINVSFHSQIMLIPMF